MVNPRLIYIVIVTMAIAVGIGIRWRALEVGFLSDDYSQYAMIKGTYPVKRSPFDLYSFVGGSHEIKKLMEYGVVPWWSHPNLRLSMLRPLSSILVVFDHHVFNKNIYGFHLHSMIWWAFLLIGVALVLREFLPMEMAAIAVILFSIEEGHGMSLTWLANRSALIAMSLAWFGFWMHIRWRKQASKAALFISIIFFILSLLGGEWAFPVFAYLLAFELLGVSDSFMSRIKALFPVTILSICFIISQRILNYGPVASEVYVNPFSEPGTFLWQSFLRIPSFFAELVFGIPVWWQESSPWRSYLLSWNIFSYSVWKRLPSWQFWHFILGVTAAVVYYYTIRWAYIHQKDHIAQRILWLLVGSLLSLIPMVASFPSTRLVVPASVGIAASWSMVILHCYRTLLTQFKLGRYRTRSINISLSILLFLGYFQVWKSASSSRAYILQRNFLHKSIKEWTLNAEIDDNVIEKQDVFLVNTSEHTISVYAPFVRQFYGHPLPRSCRILSSAPKAHDILRSAENQLDFTVLGGNILDGGIAKLYRADRYLFHKNDLVETKGLKVQILSLIGNKPLKVRFSFDKPLDDPSYLFLYSTPKGMIKFKVPEVGKQVRIPRAQFPNYRLLNNHSGDSNSSNSPIRQERG